MWTQHMNAPATSNIDTHLKSQQNQSFSNRRGHQNFVDQQQFNKAHFVPTTSDHKTEYRVKWY